MAHKCDTMEAPENIDRIISLLKKYDDDSITIEEQMELDTWINSHEDNRKLFEEINDTASRQQALQLIHHFSQAEKLNNILRTKQHQNNTVHFKAMWYRMAASILLALSIGIGIYFYTSHDRTEPEIATMQDALPGGNMATITLPDGQTIALSQAKEGIVMSEGILTYNDGTSLIDIASNIADEIPEYLTLSTPNGGQYRVTLPDGSKVWLNAASSLRYPSKFTGNDRIVELSGEGYFEVAQNKERPFIVKTGGQSVKVLGTEFNINAYDNESVVTTTLINGSISVMHQQSGRTEILRPGQQASLSDHSFIISNVDVESFIAWKNGDFLFDATELDHVLRQLERWYNIEVDYDHVPDRKLHGIISRNRNLSEVLYMIERTSGLKFHLKERRLSLSE